MKTNLTPNALRSAVGLGLATLAGSACAMSNGTGGLDGWFRWLFWFWT